LNFHLKAKATENPHAHFVASGFSRKPSPALELPPEGGSYEKSSCTLCGFRL
jgi:hypothetical protein